MIYKNKNELYLKLALKINEKMFNNNQISYTVFEYTEKELLKKVEKCSEYNEFI